MKLNFLVINISWGIHIIYVEYELTQLSNNDFTLKTNYIGSFFLSRKVTPRRNDPEQRIAVKFLLAPINDPFRRQFCSLYKGYLNQVVGYRL